jgi:hypothetical protein
MAAELVLPLAIKIEASGNGRELLTLTLRNSAPTPMIVAIPAGLIATGRTTESRVIVLRAATVDVPAQSTVDRALPTAALSLRNRAQVQAFDLTANSEQRLAALIKSLSDQPDTPHLIAQLAVLCVMEDTDFARWREFLGASANSQPTPAEVSQAIDALGLLRSIEPQRTYALARDGELKRLALRNPWCRAKAMAIYGLDVSDGTTPPDLRQLLHTQLGDNCPTCRQRALMQKPAEIP